MGLDFVEDRFAIEVYCKGQPGTELRWTLMDMDFLLIAQVRGGFNQDFGGYFGDFRILICGELW